MNFTVNGESQTGEVGDFLLAAMMNAGLTTFRSEQGRDHAPICAMGICFECLVTIKGRGQVRACMTPLESGMEVEL